MSTFITDHARIRYLERVIGIDMSIIDAALTSTTIDLADAFGCPTVILSSGHRAVIRNGCVQTVLTKGRRK